MLSALGHMPYVFLFQHGFLVFLPGLIIASVLFSLFWAWMLVDCLRNDHLKRDEKVFWAVVIACTHLVGAFIYFFCVENRVHFLPHRSTGTPISSSWQEGAAHNAEEPQRAQTSAYEAPQTMYQEPRSMR